MPPRRRDLDSLLHEWPYSFGEVSARRARGVDGRQVLQLRVDLGVLQMEIEGRPDGQRPEGFETYRDMLVALAEEQGDAFHFDDARCNEIDREFVQFYHRRVAWLSLREFDRAVRDADHTLALMDFCAEQSDDEEWVELHEQYRPFVLFHRTQAAALARLENDEPEAAIAVIDAGLAQLIQAIQRLDGETAAEPIDGLDRPYDAAGGSFDQDEFVAKLHELRGSIASEFDLRSSLEDRLAEAIASEEYELAAELRDRIAQRHP